MAPIPLLPGDQNHIESIAEVFKALVKRGWSDWSSGTSGYSGSSGYGSGSSGYGSGYTSGYGSGYTSGYGSGYTSGYGSGYTSGYGSGYNDGWYTQSPTYYGGSSASNDSRSGGGNHKAVVIAGSVIGGILGFIFIVGLIVGLVDCCSSSKGNKSTSSRQRQSSGPLMPQHQPQAPAPARRKIPKPDDSYIAMENLKRNNDFSPYDLRTGERVPAKEYASPLSGFTHQAEVRLAAGSPLSLKASQLYDQTPSSSPSSITSSLNTSSTKGPLAKDDQVRSPEPARTRH